jgi:hypothetical protein
MFVGDSYSLMGLMLGSVQNERPFEIVTAPTNSVFLGDTSNVGISFVLPASEILKVLNSKEAQHERDDFIAKRTLELNLHKMLHFEIARTPSHLARIFHALFGRLSTSPIEKK